MIYMAFCPATDSQESKYDQLQQVAKDDHSYKIYNESTFPHMMETYKDNPQHLQWVQGLWDYLKAARSDYESSLTQQQMRTQYGLN